MGSYEPEVQRIYSEMLHPGMVVYDVGSHVGFLSMLAAKLVGPQGQVVSFEPLPSNAEAIEHNAALNGFENIRIVPVALAEKDGDASFLVSADVGWGRLEHGQKPADQTGSVLVQVRRLASVTEEHNLPPPDIIKVDIEGGEVMMLQGALDVIRKYHPAILMELHGTNEPIDDLLTLVDYAAYVIGSNKAVKEAAWDAFIVCVPSGDQTRCRTAAALTATATMAR